MPLPPLRRPPPANPVVLAQTHAEPDPVAHDDQDDFPGTPSIVTGVSASFEALKEVVKPQPRSEIARQVTAGSSLAAMERAKRATEERARQVAAKRVSYRVPNRYWQRENTLRHVVVLDYEFGVRNQWNEVALKDDRGFYNVFERTPPTGVNPLAKPMNAWPYDVTCLTVIEVYDYRPEEGIDERRVSRKDGTIYTHDKRIMAIRGTDIAPWKEIFDAQGGPRGLIMRMVRGEEKQKIPKPVLVTRMSESKLLEKFGHDEVRGSSGQVFKEADSDTLPEDYEVCYPPKTAQQLCREYGVGNTLPIQPPPAPERHIPNVNAAVLDYGDASGEIPF